MSGLNRLEPGSDLATDGGRGLLQETLELFANTYRNLREELTKVKDSDKIVAPIPIEEFPTIMAVAPSVSGGAPLNSILFSKTDSQPPGYATCDGTSGTPDLRGRVPMGAGTGSGLTARAVGDVVGAETVAADLAAHTHDLGNHTHEGAAHTHDMGNHVHDMQNHVHNTTFYTVGGGATAGPAWGASGGSTNTANTSAPSHLNTSAPSTNTTGARSASTSGTPSTNTSGGTSVANAGSHANIQPSRVLKALMKTSNGDLDLPRVVPIFFGRVPARFDLEGPTDIVNASSADAFEVIETGRPPEKISEISMSSGLTAGQSTCTLKFSVYVPYNFRRWRTAAVRIRTKLAMTGCSAATSATMTLKARKPTATSGYLVGTNTRTLNVDGSGNIADSAWADMVLKTTDLQDDWQPGYFLACEVIWSFPKTFTTCSVKVGRLQINW